MAGYVCKQCGYRKTSRQVLDYVLEPPIYPFMTTNSILPFMAMDYMWGSEEVCPNCKANYNWELMP